jgi:hypothetical protein
MPATLGEANRRRDLLSEEAGRMTPLAKPANPWRAKAWAPHLFSIA